MSVHSPRPGEVVMGQTRYARPVMWSFQCDRGHGWDVPETRESVEPDPGLCPEDGLPAVVGGRLPWADRVSFVLQAAARVVDSVRDQVGDEGLYYLQLTGPDDDPIAVSGSPMPLDSAVERISELSRVNVADARRRALRMGFIPKD